MSILSFNKKKEKERQQKKAQPSAIKKRSKVKAGASGGGVACALKIGLQPLVTEKSVRLQENNVVAFRVTQRANKEQIAMAIRERYKTEPREIRTMRMLPKRRRRGQTVGATKGWKKAYVKVDDIQSFNASP